MSQIYSLVQQLVTHLQHVAESVPALRHRLRSRLPGAPNASAAQTTLQTMQYYAGTQSSASTALPSNQIITGTDTQMSTNMINAFTSILENGVQIALIK